MGTKNPTADPTNNPTLPHEKSDRWPHEKSDRRPHEKSDRWPHEKSDRWPHEKSDRWPHDNFAPDCDHPWVWLLLLYTGVWGRCRDVQLFGKFSKCLCRHTNVV